MSLTTKVAITLLALLGGYCGFSYAVMQHLMPPAFERLEQDLLAARLDGARRALQDNLDDIQQRALRWQQSVSMIAADSGWTRELLKPNDLASFDVVLSFNQAGRLLWHRITIQGNRELPVSEVFVPGLGRRINTVTLADNSTGLTSTRRSLLLTVVTEVSVGRNSGTSQRMVFGRFVSADLLKSIKQIQQTDVQVLDADLLPADQDVVYQHQHDSLHGYAQIYDLWGERAAVLKFSAPRTITDLGDKTIKSNTLILSAVGGLVTLLMWLLLRQMLLRPISELTRQINTVSGVAVVEPGSSDTEAAKLNAYKQLLGKITPKLPLTERNDEIGKLAVAFSDLSVRLQRSADRVWQLAYEDSLTGLPNRSMFMERIKAAVSHSKQKKLRSALLFMDLDGFKTINDTLGHDAGDELLQVVAERLRHCVRKLDLVEQPRMVAKNQNQATVARFGGDEFVLLLSEIKDPSDAAIVAERIIKILSQPIALKGSECTVGASIGIATFPDDADDVQSLVKCADIAMYQAKHKGKNTYYSYSKAIDDKLLGQMELDRELGSAVRKGEFELHYQPLIDITSGRTVAVEALLRWTHPKHGMIPPDQFVPLAEENGVIKQLGQWVLEQACRQAKLWQEMGATDFRVAVNVSSNQLEGCNFADLFEQTVRDEGVDPKALEVELTESCLVQAQPETMEVLNRLRSLGVRISIDDFGTGYSSLSLLRGLPIDAFKIDRSFMSDIETEPASRAVVAAILTLGRELGLDVVAEGVETEYTLEFLRQHGGAKAQGYLFARPMPPEAATAFLLKSEPLPVAQSA